MAEVVVAAAGVAVEAVRRLAPLQGFAWQVPRGSSGR